MPSFLSKTEYKTIASLYGISPIIHINYFYSGFQTPKVLVHTSKGNYIISKHLQPSRKHPLVKGKMQLLQEIKLLQKLKHLPVPQYIKAKNNQFIILYKNFYISVYAYISGKPPKTISHKHIIQLATFLANFHKQRSHVKNIFFQRRRFYFLPKNILQKMRKIAEKQSHPVLKNIIPKIMNGVLQYIPPKHLPQGPIHVDIKPENELFIKNTLMGIIDFGNFYKGPLMIDVGKTIMWNCIHHGKLNMVSAQLFWNTYKKIRRVTRKEEEYFIASIIYAIYSHIWCDLYHVPLGYVPESYTLSLITDFLPAAQDIQKKI